MLTAKQILENAMLNEMHHPQTIDESKSVENQVAGNVITSHAKIQSTIKLLDRVSSDFPLSDVRELKKLLSDIDKKYKRARSLISSVAQSGG